MTKSAAEVEREVEESRAQVGRTVEALKDKMQPRELFDEATRIMGRNSNKLLTTAVDQARENPIPVALIGLGIAWLALSVAKRNREVEVEYDEGQHFATYEGYDEEERLSRKIKAKAREAVETAKIRLSDAREKAADAVAHAKEDLAHARTHAAEGAREARTRIESFASTAQERAGEYSRQARAKFEDTLESEPLLVAAAGVAIGMAIGASLPSTPAERRYIGPTRDRLMNRGRRMAEDSFDQARGVAQRAYGQVKDELSRQNGAAGSVRERADTAVDAGVQAVRDEVEGRTAH